MIRTVVGNAIGESREVTTAVVGIGAVVQRSALAVTAGTLVGALVPVALGIRAVRRPPGARRPGRRRRTGADASQGPARRG